VDQPREFVKGGGLEDGYAIAGALGPILIEWAFRGFAWSGFASGCFGRGHGVISIIADG
jgi:hypothetical protein